MPKLWCPNAERILGPHASGGTMVGGPPRAVWHRTAGGTYESNRDFLRREGFEPHLLWDPHTGQLGQFIPADRSAFALEHASTPETNRIGSHCIQIEVVDHGETWDITDTPMKGVEAIVAWLRSLGIPDALPMGKMAKLGRSGRRNPRIWASKAGHYGHCHVPENHHTDPGRMDFRKVFASHPHPTHSNAKAAAAWRRLVRKIKRGGW